MADASLSWLNLFVSDMQTGFGPFVPVRLAEAGWTPKSIGTALSVGSAAAVLAQIPAGMLCDVILGKRRLARFAIAATMLATLMVGGLSGFIPVLLAEVLQGVAGVVLTLAITGMTLNLTQQDKLGERLGNNLRFAAIGGAAGAGLLGIVGAHVSQPAVFLAAAAFGVPALMALGRLPPLVITQVPLLTGHRGALPPKLSGPMQTARQLFGDARLQILVACVLLFHTANAALLPLAAGTMARQDGSFANIVVSEALIVSQLLTAAASPWAGRLAHRIGRRPILLLGFTMLPLRAILFAIDGSPVTTLLAQVLDGITGATFGVLVPLVVADITHRGGRFNLALGLIGVATGVGATISNYLGGLLANAMGAPAAFLALAAVGLAAVLLMGLALPETRHLVPAVRATAAR